MNLQVRFKVQGVMDFSGFKLGIEALGSWGFQGLGLH